MRKFNSVNQRNGKAFILTITEGSQDVIALDVESGKEKAISINTVNRWHEIGDEIKPEPKKKSGTDKRKKVNADQVREIREKKIAGASISGLAKEYGLSYSGMYWIVKGNTWAKLDQEEKEQEQTKYYWYEYRLRGFSPGCQPKGFASIDHNVGRLGAIAYKEPLTNKQMNDYDLDPLGVVAV